jgi:Ice-binding-like
MNATKLAMPLFVALAYGPAQCLAQSSILGSELGSFSVLGAESVTNTGATVLRGNLGVSPGTSITGAGSIVLTGVIHQTDAFAGLAQSQLTTAKNSLTSLGAGTTLGANLAGLTLSPGVYTVPAGVSNLTGLLTLNGQGDANAAWVFQSVWSIQARAPECTGMSAAPRPWTRPLRSKAIFSRSRASA